MDGNICQVPRYAVNWASQGSPMGESALVNSSRENGIGCLLDVSLPLQKVWNGSIMARFRRHDPDRVAIEIADERWTYQDLDRASANLAHFISSQKPTNNGQGGGAAVAIYAKRGAALLVALLGIVRAGCAFVILDPSYPGGRLAKCIQLAQPIGLLNIGCQALAGETQRALDAVDIAFAVDLPESKEEFYSWNRGGLDHDAGNREVNPDDSLYVAFTSGTTGIPRAVVGSHCPVSHFFEWQQRTFGLGPEDRVSMLSGLSHDPLLRDALMPLWVGATVCVPKQDFFETPNACFAWMRRSRITVAHLTPGLGHLLLAGVGRREEETLPDLRYAFFGGDVLRYKIVRRLAARAPKVTIVNFYGTTETPQVAAFHVVEPLEELELASAQASESIVPLGKGIDNTQLLILDGKGQVCQPSEIGEICVRSPYLAKRIMDENDISRRVLASDSHVPAIGVGIYKTGDLGCYLNDGTVTFRGRRDRQIKLRGYRIELDEIDAILAQDDSVLDHYVDVEGERDEEKRIVLYAARRGGPVGSKDDLRDRLAASLPGFMVPGRIVEVPRLPLTLNGKIDLESLRATRREKWEGVLGSKPKITTDTEGTLVRIFRDSLSDQQIGPDDRIKDLGMNSLQAVGVSCEIENAFKVSFSIAEILSNHDVRSLVRAIFERSSAKGGRLEAELAVPAHLAKPSNFDDGSASAGNGAERLGPPRLIPKDENFLVGVKNRLLQLAARVAPDVWRTRLHRMRGVTIGKEVSIGYDAVIETAFPWLVRIGDRVNIGMRTTVIAHFRGMASISKGHCTVDIRDGAFIGPGVIILPNVIIGEGAVVAAGSVVNHSVPPYTLVHGNPATPRARCGVALTGTTEYQEFISKLDPIRNEC